MASFTLLLATALAMLSLRVAALPFFQGLPTLPVLPVEALQSQISAMQPPNSTLAAPNSGQSLMYVALGIGTQNYTCASADAVPVAIGAAATLYDNTLATFMMSKNPDTAVNLEQQTTCNADKMDTAGAMPVLGHHYFSASGVPTFDLSEGTKSAAEPDGLFLSAKKTGSMLAPATACTGRDGAAAVPWLSLVDDGRGVSRGLSEVFRVETTGGDPLASCAGMGDAFQQDYAALYYLYGPSTSS